MTTIPTFPGVYIEEVPSQVRTIAGVPTSITAFVGRALRGPADEPVRLQSYAEFDRQFGGLWRNSMMSYAVQQFFANGGADAIIVRVANAAGTAAPAAALTMAAGGPGLELAAANPGEWGDRLRADIDHDTATDPGGTLFNLTVRELDDALSDAVAVENHRNLSTDAAHPRFVGDLLAAASALVRVANPAAGFSSRPAEDSDIVFTGGTDGGDIGFDQVANPGLLEADQRGIWALDKADLFNLLVIPPFTRIADVTPDTWIQAKIYCHANRAMVLVDPPSAWATHAAARDADIAALFGSANGENAAIYFPRVRMGDPLRENRLETFAPSGALAGIFARTDRERGVWKAPAGQDATIAGARELSYVMTDGQNGQINPLGINALRKFPVVGHVVWGARTMDGSDRAASMWKYVNVRRLALNIEESLFRGTQWVIFEPNDEPLWAQIRLNVGAYMNSLFRQGAFQGQSAREAYFVKCDRENNPQNSIDRGIVNLAVGFAPLKPAEFLIIRISQIAGDIQT